MNLLLSAPQPLTGAHLLDCFACGESILDEWLRRRALANQLSGASRTFVVVNGDDRVLGYYSLAAGAIARHEETRDFSRNMPDPVPVMVLGRLAVDRHVQDMQMGAAMLQDASRRVLTVSQNAGVRALLVHALHDRARQFYEHYGLQPSPVNPMTLTLRLPTAKVQ